MLHAYDTHCLRLVVVSDLLEKNQDVTKVTKACAYHTFTDPAAVVQLRSQLLQWYDEDQRELPWRTLVRKRPFLH